MSTPRLLLIVTATLMGCSAAEDQKAEDLADSYCTRYQDCRAEGFNKNWDSLEGCRSKEASLWLSKLDSIDGETALSCTLNDEAVKQCTDAVDAVDCSDFSDKTWEADCAAVLTCTQGMTGDW